jgi:hypothetical protein
MKILKLWLTIFKKEHFYSIDYRVLDFFSALSNKEFHESDMIGVDLSTPWGPNLYELYKSNSREGKIDYKTKPVDYFCLVRTSPKTSWTSVKEADSKYRKAAKIKEFGSTVYNKNPEMSVEELENILLGIGDSL